SSCARLQATRGDSVDLREQIQILKASKQFDGRWYRNEYPDVASSGLLPTAHYVRYGAKQERNPSRGFETKFYLSTYPDARTSGLNPLVHYILYGKAESRPRNPDEWQRLRNKARRRIAPLRRKLLTLGFTEQPLNELRRAADAGNGGGAFLRAYAARE